MEQPQSLTDKTSAHSAKEAQQKAAKARQAAALERMRAQQAEFAQREPAAATCMTTRQNNLTAY